jgi:hypothetical protein
LARPGVVCVATTQVLSRTDRRLGVTHHGDSDVPEQTVSVEFLLSKTEARRAAWKYLASENRATAVAPAAGLVAIIIGVAISLHHSLANSNVGVSTAAYTCIIVGSLMWISVAILLWWIPTSLWRENSPVSNIQKIRITMNGLDLNAGGSVSHREWISFRTSLESARAYMLLAKTNNTLVVIPKRALLSNSDEAVLRRMLQVYTHAHLRNVRGSSIP